MSEKEQSTPKRISLKTKVGDEVIDGMDRLVVTHRFGDSLVLRHQRNGYYYHRHIEGGSRRHLTEQDAINAAALPAIAAQIAVARAAEAA